MEAQRLEQRTNYDLEMMREMGFCSGIENYSVHLTLRPLGSTPYTLLDYFGDDWLVMIDESHVTLPQIRGMYNGDRARKQVLVDHGFRLPSALDNRPLKFEEFEDKTKQLVYVSATPGPYELEHTDEMVEQIIRPTGLLDPKVDVRPTENQIDDLLSEIQERVERNERVLVTTLTKKMSEDLTTYMKEAGIKVNYLHSEIKTLERIEIIRDLRMGTYDAIVGINLLREGIDIPEVSLVVILDADKEGFYVQIVHLSKRLVVLPVMIKVKLLCMPIKSLIPCNMQLMKPKDVGIYKRHIMKNMVSHHEQLTKIHDVISATVESDETNEQKQTELPKKMTKKKDKTIENIEKNEKAAKDLDFEKATELRDMLFELKAEG